MLKLIMIPVLMMVGALLMAWVDNRLPVWERNREIRGLIRQNQHYERQIEETPRKRMAGMYVYR